MTEHEVKPRLSIVMPAYNEAHRLPGSLERLDHYIKHLHRDIDVLVVENGSTDQTAEVVRSFMQHMPYLQLIQESLAGKGRAVRSGMLAASGDYLMFCDVDFSMPVEEIDKFLALLDAGAPIVIASRELATSLRHGEPGQRHIMGRVFNQVVQLLVVRGIEDTQCGFKAFQRSVGRDLFSVQRLTGWGFDVEILFVARKRGYRVQQLAIDWYYDADSRVRRVRDSFSTFLEIMPIRFYDLLGLYRARRKAKTVPHQP